MERQVRACQMKAIMSGQKSFGDDVSGRKIGKNMRIEGIDLSGRDITGVCLPNVYFPWSDLSRCIFKGADLMSSQMIGVDFHESDLSGAILNNADLTAANFTEA